jgi:hypothetical protein
MTAAATEVSFPGRPVRRDIVFKTRDLQPDEYRLAGHLRAFFFRECV